MVLGKLDRHMQKNKRVGEAAVCDEKTTSDRVVKEGLWEGDF